MTVNKMKRKKQVTQVYEKFEASSDKQLNPEEFRNFIAFVYDLQILSRVGRNQYLRILKKLGLSESDDVPKETIIDFLVAQGAQELRKKGPEDNLNLYESGEIDNSMSQKCEDDISVYFEEIQRPNGFSHAQLSEFIQDNSQSPHHNDVTAILRRTVKL